MFDFVAEIGDAHRGDRARCRRLIREAARIGCRGVVLDLSRIEAVYAPEILRVSPAHRLRRRHELPRHELPALAALAHELGLRLGLRPTDMDAVSLAADHAGFLAVGPHELPWLDLILRAAETGLPLQLDTGMAEAGEVWNAIETALEAGCTDLTLLHSVVRYPAPPASCNLAAIGMLREVLDREFAPIFPAAVLRAGWADLSAHPGVVARALHHWGSDRVTFHLDLDGEGDRHGSGHCWRPDRAAEAIAGGYLPVARTSDGTGRLAPDPGEMEARSWRADPADGLRPVRAVRRTWPDAQPESTRTGPDAYIIADGPGLEAITRCLALAETLRDDHDADVIFLVPGTDAQQQFLVRHGFNGLSFDSVDDVPLQVGFLCGVTGDTGPPLCVLDLSLPADRLAAALQRIGAMTVVVGQPDCTGADLVLMPEFGWREEQERAHVIGGSEYLLVAEDTLHWRHADGSVPPGVGVYPRIVVLFGAGDPHGLTLRTTRALHDILPHGHVQVILPPDTIRFDLVAGLLEGRFGDFEIITHGDAAAPVLAAADLLVTGPGNAVSDALCLGVPVAVLANGPAEMPAVARLAAGGAVVDLGCQADLADDAYTDRLRTVLGDPDRLSRLRFHARELAAAPIDGHGAARAVDRMVGLLRERA